MHGALEAAEPEFIYEGCGSKSACNNKSSERYGMKGTV